MSDDGLPHYRGFGRQGRWDTPPEPPDDVREPYEQGGGDWNRRRAQGEHIGHVLIAMGFAFVALAIWIFWRVIAGGGWR